MCQEHLFPLTVLSKYLHLSTFDHIEGVRRISSLEKDGFFGDLMEMKSFEDLFSFLGGEG